MKLRKKLLFKELSILQKESILYAFDTVFMESDIDKNNFNIIFENSTAPKMLYHYTSLNTLQAILTRIENEEKNNSTVNACKSFVIRATHIEYLNDVSEFKEALKLMVELLNKYECSLDQNINKNLSKNLNQDYWKDLATFFNIMTPPFITSFSENYDNLPMWNTYGQNGKGVAIGIKRTKIDDSTYESKSGKPVWGRCVYDSKILENIFSKIIGKIYEMIEITEDGIRFLGLPDFNSFSAYFSILKHAAFDYEQEWRLIKSCSSYNKEKEINFQEFDGILRPFIEHKFPKSILKEVVVGPCFDVDMSRKSIEMSLERAGYEVSESEKNSENYVAIISSQIPYRHFNKTFLHL